MISVGLNNRKKVIALTIIVFCLSGACLNNVISKEFFPSATRPELIVDMTLPQGTAIKETEAQAKAHNSKDTPEV